MNNSINSTSPNFGAKVNLEEIAGRLKGKNPNAKQYWFEDYISGSKKDLPIKYFKQMLKRRNGQ